MSDVIKDARSLKSKAIAARDKGDFTRAENLIVKAENMLLAALKGHEASRASAENPAMSQKPSEREIKVTEQLGHILGSKGGIYRRCKKYEASVKAYDQGYEFEKSVLEYGIENSYTLVQRLVTRVFIDPIAVRDNVEVCGLPMRTHLLEAEKEVERQCSGERKKDEYAAADLAIVRLLLGEPNWESALISFTHATPLPSAYALEATLDVISELRETLADRQDAPADLVDRLACAAEKLVECRGRLN